MRKRIFGLLLLLSLCRPAGALAYDKTAVHDIIVDIFKDIEAIFSWHVDDRKTLKEVAEDTARGILS